MPRRNFQRCPDVKIGTTLANMQLLQYANIPYPTEMTFSEFAIRYVRGDLSMRGDGFPGAVWKWPTGMTGDALNTLMGFGGGFTTGSALVYIRTRTNAMGANAYVSYSAQMYMPDLTGKDGQQVSDWIDGFSRVSVQFAGLVAV